jgi:tellurite resistance protein TehA-like permease
VFTLTQFAWREFLVGSGDHWVVGGALAISSLADAQLILAGSDVGAFTPVIPALRVLDLVLWAFTALAYISLAACEVLCPRLRYDLRRWATVFPLGMAAAASWAVAQAEHLPWIRHVGGTVAYVGLLAWAAVAIGALRRFADRYRNRLRRRA